MIVIELAGAPQGKGRARARAGQNGRVWTYTPERTRTYEAALRLAAQNAMADRTPLDGPVSVKLEVRMPIPASWSKRKKAAAISGELMPTGRPDLDNTLKAVADGCNEIVWRDDKQIVEATVRKQYSAAPGIRIEVAPAR